MTGLEEAVADKRASDESLPRLSQGLQVQVMPGARLPPSQEAGFELQGTITQGWSLGGYGEKRREAAAAETEVMAAETRAIALERSLGAARAWIRLHEAERREVLVQRELSAAEERVAALERAHAAGVVTRLEVADARAMAAQIQAISIEVAGEVHDLGLALARETGVRATAPMRTSGDYPAPQLPSHDEIRQRFAELEQLPEVALRRLESRAAKARAKETKASRATVMNAGVSGQLESSGDVLLFGVVGATIPVRDHNQRQQAVDLAAARRADAEADQRVLELSATLLVALHDLHHTSERMEILRDQTLPALVELVETHEAALSEGEGTLPMLLLAQTRRDAVARELATAEADWVWARVEAWLYLQAIAAGREGGASPAQAQP
nr:TolC family protein [Pseudenhygromyxa sp. WMMC2535]